MRLLDLWQHNPLGIVAGCLVWIVVALWVYSSVSWMIMGEIDVLLGIPAIFGAFALGYYTNNPPKPELGPLFFIAMLLMTIAYPVMVIAGRKWGSFQWEIQRAERAVEKLRLNNREPGALMVLAHILYDRGMPEHALGLAENAVQRLDPQFFRLEYQTVHSWRVHLANANLQRELECPSCRAMNKPGEVFCYRCGEPYLLYRLKLVWVNPDILKKLLGGWLAFSLLLVAIPATAASPMPIEAKIVLILLELGLAVFAVLRAFLRFSDNSSV